MMRLFLAFLTLLLLAWAANALAQEGRSIRLDVANQTATGAAVEVAGGVGVVRVTQGDQVELRWTTDVATELHLHGYDIDLDLAPGVEGVMAFDARATGRFAIEAHGFGGNHTEKTLIYLEVLPR